MRVIAPLIALLSFVFFLVIMAAIVFANARLGGWAIVAFILSFFTYALATAFDERMEWVGKVQVKAVQEEEEGA